MKLNKFTSVILLGAVLSLRLRRNEYSNQEAQP
jgi:hypothetical protein